MRAVIAHNRSAHLMERPTPTPKGEEVLIRVHAAGVNRADLVQVAGAYPPPPGASDVLGLEVSGHREDTGEAVVALLPGGAYAEFVTAHPDVLLPVPTGMDLTTAAGLIEAAATVVSNLVLEAQMKAGETVLIHGGNGGVGSLALQIAHLLGARVLTTVGSDEAVPTALALGADVAWNRHTTDLPDALRDEGGVDVILDVVGGDALASNVKALRTGGRLVIIGMLGGAQGELPIGVLMARRARVIGTTLRSRPLAEKAEVIREVSQIVWPLVEAGKISVPVQAVLPLEEVTQAHQVLKAGGHHGKVILQIAETSAAP